MFSFRTTSLAEQLDKALTDGKVGCFCTQNCWDADSNRYMYDIFRERGNLVRIFSPRDTELTPMTNHIEFSPNDLADLDAVVVEIQDVGSRYFNYTRDVFRLMDTLKLLENSPSLYVVDHINPAGRSVEGSMVYSDEPAMPKVAHRHGLTLGELMFLYHSEIDAKYPLHVISAMASGSLRQLMPWTIAPASDIPGLFTCDLYSGGALWNNTNICPGIGTTRPYEYIGAPFVKTLPGEDVPQAQGAMLRPCSFTPSCGIYEGRKCYGYQIMLVPDLEYHSLMHTIRLLHYFNNRYPGEFRMEAGFKEKLSDDVIYDYIVYKTTWEETREHIKVEEQKWIRKAKKYLLYSDTPYRVK